MCDGEPVNQDKNRLKKGNRTVINIVNELDVATTEKVADVENGGTFVGTVADIDGEYHTGVFLKTNSTLVFLDDPTAVFEDADSRYDSPEVTGYQGVDLTVTVNTDS